MHEDMHVTIALPWWWHTIRQGNDELTRNMAQRFKQTLLLKFHYSFEIELERFVLLGGKVLVALWRCVGERTTELGTVVRDRHGENVDPMVRLREEIIRCFVTESPDQRRKPLTYQHKRSDDEANGNPKKPKIVERQHTIKGKTPGMGVSADGFIHTTLCRLPLECLSSQDIELDKVHRLCREASATLNGHRMEIRSYRFLETKGEGGESNPCYKPLYDETINAPLQHTVGIDGNITEGRHSQTHLQQMTIGPARNFLGQTPAVNATNNDGEERSENDNANEQSLTALFRPPE